MPHMAIMDNEEIIHTLFVTMLGYYGCYHVVTTIAGRQVRNILWCEPFEVRLLAMLHTIRLSAKG